MLKLEKLKTWKNCLRPFLPPILVGFASRFVPRIRWTGCYSSWSEAERASGGYASENILSTVRAAVSKVLRGEASFERDGVVFHEKQPNFPLLAALNAASLGGGETVVVDFGGSLGSTYLQNQPWVKTLPITWLVLEQPSYVKAGRELYSDGSVQFVESLEAAKLAIGDRRVFLHSSAVIQYLSNPLTELGQMIETLSPEWIFLDRVPYLDGQKHRLTVQQVPGSIYEASYPCWFFHKPSLEASLHSGFEKVFEFPALDLCIDFPSRFEGACWRRRISGKTS